MKKIFNTIIRFNILTLLVLTSCWSAPSAESNSLTVLASTSVLANIAQNVAGDRVQVDSLLPVGADPHAYQPVPSDITKIADSNLLILNGLEYEHFIESVLENAGGEKVVIEATSGLTPHEDNDHADEAESAEGHEHEAGNPHMWLDPNLVIIYVENIRDGLIQIDPDGKDVYGKNAEAYINQLKELDAWIVEQVNQIPAERKLLVTNHEALNYFAEHYGFEVVGTILPSASTNSQASAQQMAQLIDEIKTSGVPAIFLSDVENATLAEQIASETDVKIVNDLHLESLTDGAPAETYLDMMRHNVNLIVEALK
ncbi:MAG: zinc ABC transporter substrate-binding protein [Anaerolineales bacterium]|nr:zinc ABC transporter substrate-binding protein [Anaerolineales bacterium]